MSPISPENRSHSFSPSTYHRHPERLHDISAPGNRVGRIIEAMELDSILSTTHNNSLFISRPKRIFDDFITTSHLISMRLLYVLIYSNRGLSHPASKFPSRSTSHSIIPVSSICIVTNHYCILSVPAKSARNLVSFDTTHPPRIESSS
jgi:hypothetical protein